MSRALTDFGAGVMPLASLIVRDVLPVTPRARPSLGPHRRVGSRRQPHVRSDRCRVRHAGADRAVELRQTADVSVVDATAGQAAESAPHPAVILTSDVDDITRLADTLEDDVRAIGI